MKFDKTGVYRTRDGREARVAGRRNHPNYPLVGCIKNQDGWSILTWSDNGEHLKGEERKGDLIELIYEVEFPEPPKVIVDGPGLYEAADGVRWVVSRPYAHGGKWWACRMEKGTCNRTVLADGAWSLHSDPPLTRKVVDFETLTIIEH